ncbi:MAG: hypothetical protein IMF16_03695, partial [Proteobacteria bacterium]|nr:hypothetical protein [Pseudomonadota bacterium]
RSRYDIAAQIAEESLRRPRILVFDEAQGLAKYDMVDMIRWLHDEGGHTFVMIGTPALEQVFLDHRSFAGRVALRHQLRLPSVTEIAPLFDGFPPEAIEAIHEQARGRMREIIALRERLTDLMEQRKLEAAELTPRQVKLVGRHFLLRVA